MKTVLELDRDGSRTVFHRTATAAWTHAPGERYRYWGGRHGSPRWIEMPCSCAENTPQITLAAGDAGEAGESPEPRTDYPEARRKAGAA